MKSRYIEIYILAAVVQFGRLLSYFAISLSLLERAGSSAVAYGIVAQSVPAILTATLSARMVPPRHALPALVVAHLANAGLLVWLAMNVDVLNIFTFLVLASVLGAYIRPTTQSFISAWVGGGEVKSVRIRINAILAAFAALSPVCGGLISERFGLSTLLLIDAAIYALAILLYLRIDRRYGADREVMVAATGPLAGNTASGAIALGNPTLRPVVTLWFVLLVVGSVLNGMEFAVFERAGLSEIETGFVLAGWGTGGGLAFVLAGRELGRNYIAILCAMICLSLGLFSFVEEWRFLALSLLVGGLFHAMLTGTLQTAVQFAIPGNVDDRVVWAKLHRGMAVINLTICLSLGWLLASPVPQDAVILALPSASILLFAAALVIYPGFHWRRRRVCAGADRSAR